MQIARAMAWINADLDELEPLLKDLENPIKVNCFDKSDWEHYHLIAHLRNSINAVNRLEREVLAADRAVKGDVK